MACTIETPCGGILIEDQEFARDMAQIGVARRRVRCFAGHSHTIERPRRRKYGRPVRTQCAVCGLGFERVPISRRAGRLPTCCSPRCGQRAGALARRLLDPVLVARLYARGWTMLQIAASFGLRPHEAVQTALRAAGVQPRRPGRHRATRCQEPVGKRRCGQPVEPRVWKGQAWGTRCREHRMAKDRARSLRYWRRTHGKGVAA